MEEQAVIKHAIYLQKKRILALCEINNIMLTKV